MRQVQVNINSSDDPESKLKIADEILELIVYAGIDRGGIAHVDKIAKALIRLSKPQWKLLFYCNHNNLESVPESVWELADMEALGFNSNKLKTISPAISNLTKLRYLLIDDNPIEDFPEAVCQLEQLERLFANNCKMSVIPASSASLRHLQELQISNNAFAEFPEVVYELKRLRILRMNGNKLSSLPPSFTKFRQLRVLSIADNCFDEFPLVLCELLELESLDMANNRMCELPLAITRLVHLKYLELCRNSFVRIPLFVGDLPQLSRLCPHGMFTLLVSVYSCSRARADTQVILYEVDNVTSPTTMCFGFSNNIKRSFD